MTASIFTIQQDNNVMVVLLCRETPAILDINQLIYIYCYYKLNYLGVYNSHKKKAPAAT